VAFYPLGVPKEWSYIGCFPFFKGTYVLAPASVELIEANALPDNNPNLENTVLILLFNTTPLVTPNPKITIAATAFSGYLKLSTTFYNLSIYFFLLILLYFYL